MRVHDSARQPGGADEGKHIEGNATIEPQHVAALKPRPKKLRLLEALLAGPKTSFELERAPTFDHCASSTVSEWRKQGIEILTEMVTISGYAGEPAHIARYSLADTSRQGALEIIGAAQ